MSEQAVNLEAVKQIQQKVWSEGDFSMVGDRLGIVGEELAEAAEIIPGDRVLDVACGSGNTTIPAARRAWGNTVGLDYVPELLERGRERAAAERLDIDFVEGDAENLPFDDASFDVVLSSFGVMFAPDHQKAADELLRVCKPGGRIGMANWVPDGFVGEMFTTTAKHAPPPPGVQPPPLWGTEDHLRELLGDGVSSLEVERVTVRVRLPVARPLHRVLPHLLRPDPDGLRTGRRGRRRGPRGRSAGDDRPPQHRRRAGDGRPGGVPAGYR